MRRGVGIVVLVVLAMLLAGCGSSSPKAHTSPPATASTQQQPAGGPAVAYVAGTPISKASYEHWLAVERTLDASGNLSHRALAFLITSSWILGEGSARHISISQGEAHKRLLELEHRDFPKHGQLQRYLATSKETTDDLLTRIKVELLERKIGSEVAGTASGASAKQKLASYQQSFHDHWKLLTSCLRGYVMEDCKQYKGRAEAHLSTSDGSGSTPSRPKVPPRPLGLRGETETTPGVFSISSPAFELNGSIPATYTCDGAGISPPLSWRDVPAHAAELVLIVIDDSANGKDGGIRWIVGGLSPSSNGAAAGKQPAGAVLGINGSGSAGYSPICPAPGHTDTVEFVLYALKRHIPLSPGFGPGLAEREYGTHNDILGRPAVMYGSYHRP